MSHPTSAVGRARNGRPAESDSSEEVRLAFRVSRAIKVRLDVAAAQLQRTLTDVCTEALTQYLERHDTQPIPTARECLQKVREERA